ncbi:MAG TPA: phosphate ABC transporter permease PstA [Solirubrobacterales bacterium]|nr:phosphate ABC transporter permease PstA [Solirubrobacterales bacterium]
MSARFEPRTARAQVAIAGARGVTAGVLSDQPRRDVVRNSVFASLLFLAVVVGLAGLALLVGDNLVKGWPRLNADLLTNGTSSLPANAGLRSAIVGTLWIMAFVILFIVPVGVGSAVFLEEYASRESRLARAVEVNIQNLAAVPSIIYGLLGLAFIARGPLSLGFTVLTASITLALLVLPVVVLVAREAIRAVPSSIREGSLALGATRWQTTRRQILPAAVPGIATGVILAISRAIGETAPLIPLGAATFVTYDPSGPMSGFTAMPLVIFNWVKQPQEEFQVLAAAGIVVLLAVLIAMNSFAIWLRNRYEQRW